MNSTFQIRSLVLGILTVLGCGSVSTAADLPLLLKIDWRLGPAYPMGIQDCSVGTIDGKVVCTGGFSRHPKDILTAHADTFGGEKSGFTNTTFLFDPKNEAVGWKRITDRPGVARQGSGTAVVGDEVWTFGGFSYAKPLCFRDVSRLRKVEGKWEWENMADCKLPWPLCWPGVAVIGTKIYLVGGVDYFQPEGEKSPDLHTEAGRTGKPVGKAVWMLDTADTKAGWRRMAELPGTPRGLMGVGVVGGKIYVLGGFHGALHKTPKGQTYFNAVDSWVYDPATNGWSRLPDMPHGCNSGVTTYRDRYIIMLGGYKYPQTQNPDGTRSDCYSKEERGRDWKTFFKKTVLVYDARTGKLGKATPLLDENNGPLPVILGDTIYYLGSEGGHGLWHPDTFPIGKITEVP